MRESDRQLGTENSMWATIIEMNRKQTIGYFLPASSRRQAIIVEELLIILCLLLNSFLFFISFMLSTLSLLVRTVIIKHSVVNIISAKIYFYTHPGMISFFSSYLPEIIFNSIQFSDTLNFFFYNTCSNIF